MQIRQKCITFAQKSNNMAKLKPINTIENLSGKVSQNSDMSHRTRNGKTFTYKWNPETPEKISPQKVLMQYAMKLANLRAKAELADPEKKLAYTKLLQKDKKYHELRPFVVTKFLNEIKAAVLSGDETVICEILETISSNESHSDTKAAKIEAFSTFLPS